MNRFWQALIDWPGFVGWLLEEHPRVSAVLEWTVEAVVGGVMGLVVVYVLLGMYLGWRG